MKEKRDFKLPSGKPILIVLCFIVAAMIAADGITIIPTGYTGVKSTLGQISEVPISSGVVFKIPLIQSIEKVSNKQTDITFQDKIWSETVNRTAVYFEGTTATYTINPERSAWIVAHVADYRYSLVTSGIAQSAIKSASKELNDTDVTNRSMIEPRAAEYLQRALDDKYGEGTITVNKVVIYNADFDDDYQKAIADKQRAQLQSETQAIENERNIAKAEADKKVRVTEAEAKAEAAKIEAQGQAEANKIIEDSVSDRVLENKKLEKWNGVLPMVVGSENSSVMIPFATLESASSDQGATSSGSGSGTENGQ
ncbi:MAG: SPFH domain-containing protein [Eubacteriales bacterium]|nr:SPFH domain-containing protein [Eubacteriales bacterium]